ncbi:MAG: glycoside hydrolase N-terminal domain-containing protein [Acetobacter sp.]|nr:glycoside hydrolase N-terminal domain-containing protein [Bacteroides sp.]MCM1340177.1 glycoside hydrolase N-terminal domain-containing protein [Acetobacter sp.]MCM1432871.1 glycoside hydrolase N-terminal domain-containing protein [Clostridiales bacterium]
MSKLKKCLCFALSGCIVFSLAACGKTTGADIDGVFDNENKISYCTTYDELSESERNKTKIWRQGMVSGNGLQGVVTSGSPYSDSLIYQNIHFIMPNENSRSCPVTSDELEQVKKNIIKGEDIVDNASYDDVYSFHPGGALRITQEEQRAKNYIRYTEYETAEVGVKYTDKNGTWERKTFTSKADNATITKIEKSTENIKVNLTLSYDDISTMANFGDGTEKDIKYKKLVDADCDTISFAAHYPNYDNSELKNGGYSTLTYVITNGEKTKAELEKNTDEIQFKSSKNEGIKITDADYVYLITISDRTYEMGSYNDFDSQESFDLTDELSQTAKTVAEKYTADSIFNYDSALKAHLDIYQPQFNAVTLTLDNGTSTLSNEALIKKQKGKKEINSAFAQRAYYSGRYAYLCCAGYSTSRLAGMWTGEFNPGWGSKYTMDANVNLQTSSMNSGNISSAPIGYTYMLLRQLPDWEENAYATHGYTDAIQAPVHSDGDCAVITETCYPYPFRYWNAGASWMLQPLYETLQYYGNIQIPLSDEFNLNELKSVLSVTAEDLTDDDIKNIEDKGYLDLEKEILLPLLIKSANYWEQLMSAEYYTDSNGNIHYEDGKTELENDEYYCILPSYSPENNPANYPSPSDANCAIDISACRNNLEMLINVANNSSPQIDVSKWQNMIDKLPPYLYDETGALKEWACNQFEENNEHRHLSHLYCVWPLVETQNNEELKNACIKAIENRESENEASHALVHRSLITARLKDRDELTTALTNLISSKIYYNSLMTNHHTNASSAYCTDYAIGYLGIINESLLYSNTGEIEILPALLKSGFNSGTITGLRARTQAEITELTWDIEAGTASVTIKSDIDQTVKISCGLSDEVKEITFKKDESKTINFSL